jgi:hypothetical protein
MDEGYDKLGMFVFYVNQLILFKYCNVGGYNWLYIWLKWGRYEMDVWNLLTIKIKESRYHSVCVVCIYVCMDYVSKPTVIPNHYNVILMLGTVIYIINLHDCARCQILSTKEVSYRTIPHTSPSVKEMTTPNLRK